MDMIFETLQGMCIGILGVFSVLCVFYFTIKLLMLKTNSNKD